MIYNLNPWDWNNHLEKHSLKEKNTHFFLASTDPFLTDLFIQHCLKPNVKSNPVSLSSQDITTDWLEEKRNKQATLFPMPESWIIPLGQKYPKEIFHLEFDFLMIVCDQIPKEMDDWDIWVIPPIKPPCAKKFFFTLGTLKSIPINVSDYNHWNFLADLNIPINHSYEYSQILDRYHFGDFVPCDIPASSKGIGILFWDKKFSQAFEMLVNIDPENQLETLRLGLNDIKFLGIQYFLEGKLPKWRQEDFIKAMVQIGNWEIDLRNSTQKVHWCVSKIRLSYLKGLALIK